MFPRSLLALWCSRAVQATPGKRRALFERSEFARSRSRRTVKGTRRATPRPTWFWVLLPKQKGLVRRGETRHLYFFAPIENYFYTTIPHRNRIPELPRGIEIFFVIGRRRICRLIIPAAFQFFGEMGLGLGSLGIIMGIAVVFAIV
jgi:hypothetical protein